MEIRTEKIMTVRFRDLSWPNKAAIIGGWIALISYAIGFIYGWLGIY